MENQTTPCKALVLAGGGARGSYQVGVWKALMELDWHPQIITGTSVGSLNGAMFVLDLYEVARDMWLTIRSKDVMELPEENADLSALHSFLRSVVKAGGMDVSPLEEIVERVLDEDALRRADIRFGLVTVEQRGLKARELTLDEIPQGRVKDYLMASAACFPALRARGQVPGRRLQRQHAHRPCQKDGGRRAGVRGPGGGGHHPPQPHRSAHHHGAQLLGAGRHPAL